ncbi:MAG: hypothetical protein QXI16_02735 [Sulfolobaceae archaeon]
MGTGIKDVETNEYIDWSEIFFLLHHYCHLNKWEIWEYTLPQITELLKKVNKYIEFEVNLVTAPIRGLVGGGGGEGSSSSDDEYHIATEQDIMDLARILGGG